MAGAAVVSVLGSALSGKANTIFTSNRNVQQNAILRVQEWALD